MMTRKLTMDKFGERRVPATRRRSFLTALAAGTVLLTTGSLGSAGVSVSTSAVEHIATYVDDISPSDPLAPPSSVPPEPDPTWLIYDPDYFDYFFPPVETTPEDPTDGSPPLFTCPNLTDPTVCPPVGP